MKGRPTDSGLLVAEGPHLVEELFRSSWTPHTLVVTPEAFPAWEVHARKANLDTIVLPSRTFSTISSTETTQGVLALARPVEWTWKHMTREHPLIVALDGLQDPGNAGTIVRSAEAFGATGIIFLAGCVRVANVKLMRASSGSLFRLPLLENVERDVLVSTARSNRLRVYSLSAGQGRVILRRVMDGAVRHRGRKRRRDISEDGSGAAEHTSIPMYQVESPNAGYGLLIALFEASRQRRLT